MRILSLTLALYMLCSPLLVGASTPLGIEITTGYHSRYTYAGFLLGKNSQEWQLSSFFPLGQTSHSPQLSALLWYAGGLGQSSFEEKGLSLEYSLFLPYDITLSAGFGLRDFSHLGPKIPLKDASQYTITLHYPLNNDWSLDASTLYDSAAKGILATFSTQYSYVLNKDSFLLAKLSYQQLLDFYLENDGQLSLKLAYTIHLTDSFSFSPFISFITPFNSSAIRPSQELWGALLELRF